MVRGNKCASGIVNLYKRINHAIKMSEQTGSSIIQAHILHINVQNMKPTTCTDNWIQMIGCNYLANYFVTRRESSTLFREITNVENKTSKNLNINNLK